MCSLKGLMHLLERRCFTLEPHTGHYCLEKLRLANQRFQKSKQEKSQCINFGREYRVANMAQDLPLFFSSRIKEQDNEHPKHRADERLQVLRFMAGTKTLILEICKIRPK
jgi:hypothetical protein